ncbi:MAG: IS1182 family transposase [Dehalococcoidales bacterium]|nr:IS1182 family transposase [Dehalococcoidales bacterium]
MQLLPSSIEEYVSEDAPVRVYDALVEALNMEELGISIDKNQEGNPRYDPKAMLKLLIYGYSYGFRSSRKLERETYYNLSFIWLMGGLKPDHKTIAEFRRRNREAIAQVLKQTVRLCLKMDLVDGNCLFVDSTRIRGAASIGETRSRKKWEEKLRELDQQIEELLDKCDAIDEAESGSLVKTLQGEQKLKEKVAGLLKQMKQDKCRQINGTDTDSVNFKSRQGKHSGYSAHITVDEKHGLIVNADTVSEANDSHQFSRQIQQAEEMLGQECKTAVADAGYSDLTDIKATVLKGTEVIIPSRKQALHQPIDNPFGKDKFRYDPDHNYYLCPENRILRYSHYSKVKNHYIYRIERTGYCLECPHYAICTNGKKGRSLARLKEEELKETLEQIYSSEGGQAIYKKRKEKAELPFGHIKRNLNCGAFLVRGIKEVKAEFTLLASCFNIARIITLIGSVPELVKKLVMISA